MRYFITEADILHIQPTTARNIIKVHDEYLIDLDNIHSMSMDYDESTSVKIIIKGYILLLKYSTKEVLREH
ncbi:hypothetical protein HYO65_gp169 [Tenacibaculum phage PTm1]|uniref:Uncharacterized protein n=2 Tax=Shirahamavirus PTm1 TaxID=2846435 RepID=A0A5S9BZ32_9CAUD|nr:hypothetical protein HYO65_gp169 [Tenacibaculum phage PTm1]BBI90561.1 hypothetical protein [Tenacibaculum phage PTm1]BBI90869.1 hypothetical protein [Tenacibaculum phage PTm5]